MVLKFESVDGILRGDYSTAIKQYFNFWVCEWNPKQGRSQQFSEVRTLAIFAWLR